MDGANEEQREYWNGEEARHWVDKQARFDEMLAPFGDALLAAAAIQPGHGVVDIGCGNGATTRAAARAATHGRALGLDLSEGMCAQARELAAKEGLENVAFEADDAQTRTFEPEFDRAISRFGVMFFDDPVAAFANIRSGLREGGKVCFIVWQGLDANEWLSLPCAVALEHVDVPEAGGPNEPGPFSLADTDRVHNLFTEAGFSDLTIEPFEAPVLIGGCGTLDTAVEFLRHTRLAQAMLSEAPDDAAARAIAAIREALSGHLTDDGVRLGSAAWIVTAS